MISEDGDIYRLRTFRILISIALLLLFVPFKAEGFFPIDPESEIEIGKKVDIDIVKNFGLIKDKKLKDYVDQVGQKIVSNIKDPIFDYHFKVLDSSDVNAFALPGGYIYVTRGILAFMGSEAELAVVLGHEIGHVTSHHSVKQMQKMQGSFLLTILGLIASRNPQDASAWVVASTTLSQHILSGYGREAEMQSDNLSLVYSTESGYDPRVISLFFRKLKAKERFGGQSYHGFLASHPDTIERIISSEGQADSIVYGKDSLIINKKEFLQMLDGLNFGKGEGKKYKITNYKIKIHEVTKEANLKDTVTEITGEPINAPEIALINGKKLNSVLKPGELIKLIIRDE